MSAYDQIQQAHRLIETIVLPDYILDLEDVGNALDNLKRDIEDLTHKVDEKHRRMT